MWDWETVRDVAIPLEQGLTPKQTAALVTLALRVKCSDALVYARGTREEATQRVKDWLAWLELQPEQP